MDRRRRQNDYVFEADPELVAPMDLQGHVAPETHIVFLGPLVAEHARAVVMGAAGNDLGAGSPDLETVPPGRECETCEHDAGNDSMRMGSTT